MKKWYCMILAVVFALVLLAPAAQAEVDFSGEQITWIIPFRVGGGSDVWSRLYAPFFQKYLPGNPIVAVKNMPGGGSITGGNHFEQRVRGDDGLTVFGSSGSTSFPYLLGNSKVRYDFAKYHIVFASPTGGVAYINPELGVKSAADLKGFTKEMNYASQGATSLDIVPLLGFDLLGLNVKAVFGYKGRGAGRVAFEHVCFSYDGHDCSEPVLAGVNLVAEPGEEGAILGPTGWGKSSLIHLIPRFYDYLLDVLPRYP